MYRHVIFDLDGTLIDSLSDLAAAVNHVRGVMGLPPLVADRVRTFIGEGARRLIERAVGADAPHRVTEGLERFLVYYGEHLLEQTRLYPGMETVLDQLVSNHVRLSVLSNKPVEMSRKILAGLGVMSYFAQVVGGNSLASRKPDPAGVLHLVDATGTGPAQTLMVGDSYIDATTAAAAGVGFCGVAWGFSADTLRAHDVAPIVTNPADLLAIVLANGRD